MGVLPLVWEARIRCMLFWFKIMCSPVYEGNQATEEDSTKCFGELRGMSLTQLRLLSCHTLIYAVTMPPNNESNIQLSGLDKTKSTTSGYQTKNHAMPPVPPIFIRVYIPALHSNISMHLKYHCTACVLQMCRIPHLHTCTCPLLDFVITLPSHHPAIYIQYMHQIYVYILRGSHSL